jgi:hypothetical protein
MNLFCRNPNCQYHNLLIPGRTDSLKCPSCGRLLLGGSVADLSLSAPALPSVLEKKPAVPVNNPGPVPTIGVKPDKKPSAATMRSTPERPHAAPSSATPQPKRDDPNMTRPLHGNLPGVEHKPRFVLEMIEDGRVYPMDFIDETRETPLFSKDEGKGRRHLANLRTTPDGVELVPIDRHSRFFVQITSAVRLTTGSRFRIGDYLVEARLNPQVPAAEPATDAGGSFQPQQLAATGEIVFLQADGSDGLRFPILRKIVIGRGGSGDPSVDIPLLNQNVSRKHAAVAPGTGSLKLKNLSANGTYVECRSPRLLVEGDRFRLGDFLLQLVRYPRQS